LPVPAYPNFDPILQLDPDSKGITIKGPLPPRDAAAADPDGGVVKVNVTAIVRQAPGDGPPPSVAKLPAATSSGDATVPPSDVGYTIPARTVGELEFRQGWAHASATALIFKANGNAETYAWSRWVWLDPSGDRLMAAMLHDGAPGS
jgi:hypothetical protein